MKRLFQSLVSQVRGLSGNRASSFPPDRVWAGSLGVMSAPVNSEYAAFRHTIHYR